mgnify:CR=1 FL=1
MTRKLIIDAETADRWAREAHESGDEGSVLAARPPHLKVLDEHEHLQARLRSLALAASAGSIGAIAAAYVTGRWSILTIAAALAAVGMGLLVRSATSARAFQRERYKSAPRIPT